MYSMTGYGRASALYDNLEISIEVHSVNRKALDANINNTTDCSKLM